MCVLALALLTILVRQLGASHGVSARREIWGVAVFLLTLFAAGACVQVLFDGEGPVPCLLRCEIFVSYV